LIQRLNYGLAISQKGDYQVILTCFQPGVRDDFSRTLDEPFSFFVATYQWVEQRNNFHHLQGDLYLKHRQAFLTHNQFKLKEDILAYHGVTIQPIVNTW
jgi:hypothetical protein